MWTDRPSERWRRRWPPPWRRILTAFFFGTSEKHLDLILLLLLLTYFAVISGFVYDVIVEPPGIGSTQDRTGAVKPVVFMPGRLNGQYIIEGISSGFMFLLGGVGLVLMDLALDKNRARSVRVSLAAFGISAVVIGYVMAMLSIRIKVPSYLW